MDSRQELVARRSRLEKYEAASIDLAHATEMFFIRWGKSISDGLGSQYPGMIDDMRELNRLRNERQLASGSVVDNAPGLKTVK